jgi:repressor LexA
MVQYLRANTYQPSIREIGERFGIKSTKTVSEHLQSLADKGHLERDPSRSRGVKILGVDLSAQTVSVPCFSEVPDGRRGAAEIHLSIDRRLAGEKGAFFVRAGANDLALLGVHEGDFVLVQPVPVAELEDGAIVAARDESGGGFFRMTRNGTALQLEPLRPGVEAPIVLGLDGVGIVGKVAAFYRRFDESAGGLNLTQH